MTRLSIIGWLAIGLLVIAPVAGLAQEHVPHQGSTAVGIDFGAYVPSTDQLDVAPVIGALFRVLPDAARQCPNGIRHGRSLV